MKLTWAFLNNADLMPAMIKLTNSTKIPAKPAYRIGKFAYEVERELEKLKAFGKGIINECCEMDEAGNPKVVNGKWVFKSTELEKRHDEEFDRTMSNEFEVSFSKIPLEHLKEVGLTPKELVAIEPILDVAPSPLHVVE